MALLMASTSMSFADLIDITPHENFLFIGVSSTFIWLAQCVMLLLWREITLILETMA